MRVGKNLLLIAIYTLLLTSSISKWGIAVGIESLTNTKIRYRVIMA
jgi:hypothetical protein